MQRVIDATQELAWRVESYVQVLSTRPLGEITQGVDEWRRCADALSQRLREHQQALADYRDDADRHD